MNLRCDNCLKRRSICLQFSLVLVPYMWCEERARVSLSEWSVIQCRRRRRWSTPHFPSSHRDHVMLVLKRIVNMAFTSLVWRCAVFFCVHTIMMRNFQYWCPVTFAPKKSQGGKSTVCMKIWNGLLLYSTLVAEFDGHTYSVHSSRLFDLCAVSGI